MSKRKNIRVSWEGKVSDFSELKMQEVLKEVSNTYDIPLDKIEVRTRYTDTRTDENISSRTFTNFFSEENIKQTYLDYINDCGINMAIDKFFNLDSIIEGKIQEKIADYKMSSSRNFRILYIRGENLFSFGKFERFFKNDGLVIVTSNPGNMGGKTSLERMIPFLLYGKKLGFDNKRTRTLFHYFNRYADSNEAFIEGEVQVGDTVYYLRRNLTRSNNKSSVSHEFMVKSKKIGETDWVNETWDTPSKTLSKFQYVIGDYEDYIFSSHYNSLSIERWINMGDTDKYRTVIKYLGLSILEDKYEQAKELYSEFRLNNKQILSYDLNELEQQFEELSIELKSYKNSIDAKQTKADLSKKELSIINGKIDELYDKITSYSISNYSDDFLEIKAAHEKELKGEISNLTDSIESFDVDAIEREKKRLEGIYDQTRQDLDALSLDIDEERINSLRDSKYSIDTSDFEDKIEKVKLEIDKVKKVKNSIGYSIKSAKEKIESLPVESMCDTCGSITNNRGKIEALKADILNYNGKLKKVNEKLSSLENGLKVEINNKKTYVISQQKFIDNQIDGIKNSAQKKYQLALKEKQSELASVRGKIGNQHIFIDNHKKNIEFLDEKKKAIRKINSEIEEYYSNKSLIKTIGSLKGQITKQKQKKEEIEAEYNDKLENLYEAKNLYNLCKSEYDVTSQRLSALRKLKVTEKVYDDYLYIHSKKGLSKYILDSLFPMMNKTLAKIMLKDFGFTIEMSYKKNAIKYHLVRDGNVKAPLYTGSGFEKTVSCLSLHYVHVLLTSLPKCNHIVLDEIVDRVKFLNIDALFRLISRFKDVYEVVDVIAHDNEDYISSKYADDVIHITKNDEKISKID